uniref:Uncharacterized protein n=1 Tax=viral metagenome TaxID=1070528 RepID=A0A2V0RAH2_9ZZZZ
MAEPRAHPPERGGAMPGHAQLLFDLIENVTVTAEGMSSWLSNQPSSLRVLAEPMHGRSLASQDFIQREGYEHSGLPSACMVLTTATARVGGCSGNIYYGLKCIAGILPVITLRSPPAFMTAPDSEMTFPASHFDVLDIIPIQGDGMSPRQYLTKELNDAHVLRSGVRDGFITHSLCFRRDQPTGYDLAGLPVDVLNILLRSVLQKLERRREAREFFAEIAAQMSFDVRIVKALNGPYQLRFVPKAHYPEGKEVVRPFSEALYAMSLRFLYKGKPLSLNESAFLVHDRNDDRRFLAGWLERCFLYQERDAIGYGRIVQILGDFEFPLLTDGATDMRIETASYNYLKNLPAGEKSSQSDFDSFARLFTNDVMLDRFGTLIPMNDHQYAERPVMAYDDYVDRYKFCSGEARADLIGGDRKMAQIVFGETLSMRTSPEVMAKVSYRPGSGSFICIDQTRPIRQRLRQHDGLSQKHFGFANRPWHRDDRRHLLDSRWSNDRLDWQFPPGMSSSGVALLPLGHIVPFLHNGADRALFRIFSAYHHAVDDGRGRISPAAQDALQAVRSINQMWRFCLSCFCVSGSCQCVGSSLKIGGLWGWICSVAGCLLRSYAHPFDRDWKFNLNGEYVNDDSRSAINVTAMLGTRALLAPLRTIKACTMFDVAPDIVEHLSGNPSSITGTTRRFDRSPSTIERRRNLICTRTPIQDGDCLNYRDNYFWAECVGSDCTITRPLDLDLQSGRIAVMNPSASIEVSRPFSKVTRGVMCQICKNISECGTPPTYADHGTQSHWDKPWTAQCDLCDRSTNRVLVGGMLTFDSSSDYVLVPRRRVDTFARRPYTLKQQIDDTIGI